MTNLDLKELSLSDLKDLRKSVEKAIATHAERAKANARAQVEELARSLGFSLAELAKAAPRARRVSAVRYRHPENPSMTWSGMGRRPAWFADWLKAGKSADDLKIA